MSSLIPEDLPWSSLYWIFSFVIVIMFLIISFVKLPKVELKDSEKVGAIQSYTRLFKQKKVILYFFGIMAYVGTEQGLANWMSKFLATYHGFSPAAEGASAIAWFWGLMSIGCLLGLGILRLVDAKLVLKVFTVLAMVAVAVALFGSAKLSLWAFPATGFFISIMFSVIFSLGLNSEKSHHGSLSGILCTGIFGGALVPLIIGWIGDQIGLRFAMLFLYITLGYIFYIPFWAKPLVDNKIVKLADLFTKK